MPYGEGDTVILVIGGRSKIGSALIELLQGKGEDVRALARASEDTAPGGVETVTGDLGDPDSLRRAMEGVRNVFLLSSRTTTPSAGIRMPSKRRVMPAFACSCAARSSVPTVTRKLSSSPLM